MKKTATQTNQTNQTKDFQATKTQSDFTVSVNNNQVFIKWVSVRYDKQNKLQNNFFHYKFAPGITLQTVNDFIATTNADYISKEITDRFLEKWIAKKIVKSEIDDALLAEMSETA